MENQFSVLGISEAIVKSIDEMGFKSPTVVQERAIPEILEGRDVIVMSKTGSGKTGAFGIPMIQQIEPKAGGPQALILTPTRELAVQVDHDLKLMSKHKQLSMTAVYGQHSMNVEVAALEKGIAILTGTPGRVFDHIKQGNFKTDQIKYLVLDEADRMLDMGFIDQVVRIIKALPKDRLTLLFSATMPTEIQKICKAYMNDPVNIEIESDTKTVDTIKQSYFRVQQNEKRTQLDRLIKVEQPDSCMVFCNTRIAVDKVQAFLTQRGYTADSLHGANTQSSRLRTINGFKKGEFQILVATDVAARGIHIDDLSLVINYDVPVEKDSYVHRIGRTGRAGNGGRAFSLVTSEDIMSLYEIEEHVGVLIEEEELPTDEAVAEAVAKAALIPSKFKPRPQKLKAVQLHHDRKGSSETGPKHGHSRDAGRPGDSKGRPNANSGKKTSQTRTQRPEVVHAEVKVNKPQAVPVPNAHVQPKTIPSDLQRIEKTANTTRNHERKAKSKNDNIKISHMETSMGRVEIHTRIPAAGEKKKKSFLDQIKGIFKK